MKLNVVILGLMDYKEALDIQQRLHRQRMLNKMEDCLLLLEHPPVLTIGRRGSTDNILMNTSALEKMGVKVYEVSRGGDVTYHGPGQIVGYPILDLTNFDKDVKEFVWKVEEVFIRLLDNEYGIKASREEKKYTGVWVDDNKITAIGIAVKQWITMHGFAFNVNTDLDHFKWINPCGITDRGVTSLQKLTGEIQEISALNITLIRYFSQVFGYEAEITAKEDFMNKLLLLEQEEGELHE